MNPDIEENMGSVSKTADEKSASSSKTVSFSDDVLTREFEEDARLKLDTSALDLHRFFQRNVTTHTHTALKPIVFTAYPASKIPCCLVRQIEKYIDLLKQYDAYYATAYIQMNKLSKAERSFDSRRFNANRAILKLNELCKLSDYYGQPIYELGCPPAKFLKYYEHTHGVRVYGCGLESRVRQDLNPEQLEFFNAVRKEGLETKGMYIFDQNAKCGICLNAVKNIIAHEGVKILISDMGYSINYNAPPFNWFEYTIYLLSIMKNLYVDIIVKIQQFGATINHYRIFSRFLKISKLLGYSLSFHKPTASWAGNDEIYIFATRCHKPKINYLSLSHVIDEMIIYRSEFLKKFRSSLKNGC